MSSHQMASIEEFCTDILILNKGKTVLKGNLKEIKEGYKATRLEISTNKNINEYIQNLNMSIEFSKNNEYSIKIDSEEKAHQLLQKLVNDHIEVAKFEIKKPTLNDIFIEKVEEKIEN